MTKQNGAYQKYDDNSSELVPGAFLVQLNFAIIVLFIHRLVSSSNASFGKLKGTVRGTAKGHLSSVFLGKSHESPLPWPDRSGDTFRCALSIVKMCHLSVFHVSLVFNGVV